MGEDGRGPTNNGCEVGVDLVKGGLLESTDGFEVGVEVVRIGNDKGRRIEAKRAVEESEI